MRSFGISPIQPAVHQAHIDAPHFTETEPAKCFNATADSQAAAYTSIIRWNKKYVKEFRANIEKPTIA